MPFTITWEDSLNTRHVFTRTAEGVNYQRLVLSRQELWTVVTNITVGSIDKLKSILQQSIDELQDIIEELDVFKAGS